MCYNVARKEIIINMEDKKLEKKCECENCSCGCHEGKACTCKDEKCTCGCGDDCKCDENSSCGCHDNSKECNCK